MSESADKVMFEIYRQADAERYRVVYFTELGDHNREVEIDRAMAGTPLFDGFLAENRLAEAKLQIHRWLRRLNGGEAFDTTRFERDLQGFLVES